MCNNETMVGIVTDTNAAALTEKPKTQTLEDMFRIYSARSFVSYAELMSCLGVPASAYSSSSIQLKNGRKASLMDPQMGWGTNGFGYYMTTFIETR